MASSMKRSGGGLFASKIKKYSLENAGLLCDEVTRLGSLKSEDLVDTLRELVEVVVWGDKHEEDIFDLFMERTMLESFVLVFCDEEFPPSIRVQCVQCVTILFQNLTRQSSTFFLLSGDRINRMITATFDEADEELISNYVSFLKTLSLRLTNDTVQFFFNNQQLPLFTEAIGLLAHDDRMVRTSARSIVVNVLQLSEPNVVAYILADDGRALLDALMTYMTRELSSIDRSFQAISDFTPKSSQLPLNFSTPVSTAASPQPADTLDGEDATGVTAAANLEALVGKEEGGEGSVEPEAMNPAERGERARSQASVTTKASAAPISASLASPMTSMSPHGGGGGVTTPLPSSIMQLDASIEDLVDDFYYYNDLMCIENTDFARLLFIRLQGVVANTLLNPRQALTRTTGTLDVLSLDLRLLMLSHWIRVNTIQYLHPLLLYAGFALAPLPIQETEENDAENNKQDGGAMEEGKKDGKPGTLILALMQPLPPLPFDGVPLVLQGLKQVEGSGASHRTYAIALNLVSTAAKARTTRSEEKAYLLDTKPVTSLKGDEVFNFSSAAPSLTEGGTLEPTLSEGGTNSISDAVIQCVFALVAEPCLLRLNTLQLGLSIISQLPLSAEVRYENLVKVSTLLQRRLGRRLDVSMSFFDALVKGSSSGVSMVLESKDPQDGRETSEELVFQELRAGIPETRETLNANEVFFSLLEQHMTQLLPALVAPTQNTAIEKVGRESSAMVPLFPPFRRLPFYGRHGGDQGKEGPKTATPFDALMMHNLALFGSQQQEGTVGGGGEKGPNSPTVAGKTQVDGREGSHSTQGISPTEYASRQRKYLPERTTPLNCRIASNPKEQETVDILAFLISRHCLKTKFFKKRSPPTTTAGSNGGGDPLACVDGLLEDSFLPFTTNVVAQGTPSSSTPPLHHYKAGAQVSTEELSQLAMATASLVASKTLLPAASAVVNQNDSGVRCEYAPAPADLLPQPMVGSVLYAYFVGSQLLLVQPDKSVAHKGTVAFALPLLYCEAMVHCRHYFRLTLEQSKPLRLAPSLKQAVGVPSHQCAVDDKHQLRVGISLRDRKACQELARLLHARGKQLRDEAAVLGRRIVREEIVMN